MERSFIKWRGHRICVSESGEGKPLFLVPGIGCSADMWQPFMPYFPNRRLISFDAPGAGRSSTPLYPVPVASLAALAAAVLDDRGVECTDVIGFSYGGAIAQQLAYDHPERVRRLVLAATNCGWGSYWGSPAAMAVMATPLRFYSASYFERVAADVYGGVTGRDAAKRQGASGARRRLPPSHVRLRHAAARRHRLVELELPARHSARDARRLRRRRSARAASRTRKMLAERIPRAQLAVVERAGHLLLWDEPERVAPQIGKFVGWG